MLQFYCKVQRLLQNATILLQNATVITNATFITKYAATGYYQIIIIVTVNISIKYEHVKTKTFLVQPTE